MAERAPSELAALDSIRDLARRYAHFVWQRDASGAADLFTEDAVMDTGDREPIRGREALREIYTQIFAKSAFRPFIHNHVVDLAGDRASGTCCLDLRSTEDGREMKGHGFYVDEYVRTAEGWKFASRRLTMCEYAEI